jgi:ethanolamine ammonia-lyase small subunit
MSVDPLARLRAMTSARVGLGRSGPALPTAPLLAFQRDHALARDAVHAPFDPARVAAGLEPRPTVTVASEASDRATYLRRPDLGRRLDGESAARLSPGEWDLAIVIGDGLSAPAVHAHAAPVAVRLIDRLADWRVAPIVLARMARVALGDEIGVRLGARMVVVLIGERPGLSAADSLGAYLTWAPAPGRRDSERNCVSNIRPPHGLGYDAAADTLAWLIRAAGRLKITGVALKDDRIDQSRPLKPPPPDPTLGVGEANNRNSNG